MIIAGKDCSKCKFGTIENFKVQCAAKEKTYVYGQKIPCDQKEERDEREVGEDN